jgi:hypothetical protein
MEERWTTVASFVESNHKPRSAVGNAMLQQVTSEAVAMARLVEPYRVVDVRQLRRPAGMLLVSLICLTAFLALNWPYHRILLLRFCSPLTDITATQLECLSGNLIVPRGEPIELIVRQAGMPRETATIVVAMEGEGDTAAELGLDPEQPALFRYSLPAVETSFRYRVQAGDGRTAWHSVKAIDRPALAEVKLTLTAPEYVDRPVFQKDYLPPHLQAVQGSRLRLEMRPATRLKQFELQFQSEPPAESRSEDRAIVESRQTLLADADGWYRFEMNLEEDLTVTPALLSPHDLANDDPVKCRIRVIPDRAPIARVISPSEEMAVRPDEVIEVKFEAHDDHGIEKAELVVYEESANGEPPTILGVQEIPLGDQQDSPHVAASAKLDLSQYELQNGSSISYAVRVTDNRIAAMDKNRGGESAQSEKSAVRDGGDLRSDSSAGSETRAERAETGSERAAEGKLAQSEGDQPTDAKNAIPTPAAPVDGRAETNPSAVKNGRSAPMADEVANADRQSGSTAENPTAVNAADNAAHNANPAVNANPALAPAENDPAQSADARSMAKGKAELNDISTASPIASKKEADGKSGREGGLPESDPVAKSDSPSTDPSVSASDTGADEKLVQQSDTPASSGETEPPGPSKASANMQVRREAESNDKSNPGSESATASSNANDSPQESEAEAQKSQAIPDARPTSANDPASAVVRRDAEPLPGQTDPSLVSGDLKSAKLRPVMTDDMPGQLSESNRLRLKIEEKVISAAEGGVDREPVQFRIRRRLEQIDAELKPAEETLSELVATVSQAGIADPQIQELTKVDQRLANVDKFIADLRSESKETPYAFVGLQMVEIGAAQITPARDRVFSLIRQPDVDAPENVAEALHRVSRARELLAELLVRYERVLREERLADSIEQTAKFYEVYVENLHRFLRAQSKPNPNPLQRKLAIVEVDDDYLDRLREVTEMRRDLMAEFARMLGDDPRLLSKYMDLLKRRQTSLRDRLTELHERQQVIATELSGWLRVDEAQREDVWMLAAEVRLQDVAPLAQEISTLEERTSAQFPLALDRQIPDSTAVLQSANQLATSVRTAAAKSRRLLRDPSNDAIDLAVDIEGVAFWLAELDTALEELAFRHASEETTDYTTKRLAESRTLAERIGGWTEIAGYLPARRYDGLAKIDQQQLALRTELLRTEMNGIDEQLNNQFRGEVPESVTVLANELKQLMESITFNQAAATFELESQRLKEAEAQQGLALDGFQQAEELFDRIRRQVVEELDKVDPQNPNIADLEDPTLDELLEQLEREPDLNALLGLPNRPQNLRVISDFVASFEGTTPVPLAMADAAEQARRRAQDEAAEARRQRREEGQEEDMTEQEWRQVADAEEAQEKMQEKIDELRRQAADPQTEPEDAEKMRQMADQLSQMQRQLASRQIDKQQWDEMVRSDQMRAVLRAAAQGEPLPDSQWNRLMSSLGDGLWQVQRRTPPEEFRQAIEQYQERIRKVINLEKAVETP